MSQRFADRLLRREYDGESPIRGRTSPSQIDGFKSTCKQIGVAFEKRKPRSPAAGAAGAEGYASREKDAVTRPPRCGGSVERPAPPDGTRDARGRIGL